jgi:hypothetical protein
MNIPGEDNEGFRALAERSMLADNCKDAGVVTMFPKLAEEWQEQVEAQRNWKTFNMVDLLRLRQQYGVSWVVLQNPGISGMSCPFRNDLLSVCEIPSRLEVPNKLRQPVLRSYGYPTSSFAPRRLARDLNKFSMAVATRVIPRVN